MFCTHCGSQIKDNAKFCAACGQPSVAAEGHTTPPPQPLVQKKAMPFWLKIVTALAILALIVVSMGILFTESIVEVVDDQLDTLKSNDVTKAYYAYTSSGFQKSTTLEKFKQFIKSYPELSHIQSSHFSERGIKDDISTIKGTLTSTNNVKIPVEYQLIKEDGKWKILNMQLLTTANELTVEEKDERERIIATVKAQLEALKDKEVTKAYENFTTPEFKAATDAEAFKGFIERFPVLSNHTHAEYALEGISPEVAILKATLEEGGKPVGVEYNMSKKDGSWKVWSIRILE